ADWLHREAMYILNHWGEKEFGAAYDELDEERQAQLRARLQKHLRENTYNLQDGTLTISPLRAEAFRSNSAYYASLFTDDPEFASLREQYAIPANAIKDPERMEKMNAFFFWASWACVTTRPGVDFTYSNNWPPDELVGNK